MGIGTGFSKFNIFQSLASSALNPFNKRAANVSTGPCDGWVLKLHYKLTFWLFMGGFACIWYSWFQKDIIVCYNSYNADMQVRSDYLNICASYVFVPDDNVVGGRRYLMYYRWIHWALFFIGLIYYIPHKLSKYGENPKLKKIFDDHSAPKFKTEDNIVSDHFSRCFLFNMGTNNNLFLKYFAINVVSFIINILAFLLIDLLLQGRFSDLGYGSYPFNRNIAKFNDEVSMRFPPFADCMINAKNMLTSRRTEKFGCHLTYMELYEKYFMVLWAWMIIVSVLTAGYIVYLSLFFIPCMKGTSVRSYLLKYYTPEDAEKSEIESIDKKLKTMKLGDFYVLCRMKTLFTGHSFYEILQNISNYDGCRAAIERLDQNRINPKKNSQDPLRSRTNGPAKNMQNRYGR